MNPTDILVIAIIAAILIPVICFLRISKKKGTRCIGCPNAGRCAHCCGSCNIQKERTGRKA